MFATLVNLRLLLWPFNHTVKISNLETYIRKSKAESWHLYAIRHRSRRPHVCLACEWLADSLGQNDLVFETGCGSGINLFWLAKRGFRNICGADLSTEAVSLANYLAEHLDIEMDIWQDDCLSPKHIPHNINGLIALNWLYHIPNISLDKIFIEYKDNLAAGAKVVFDMVDVSYNFHKNNEFHSDDISLPLNERRKTEYHLRLSKNEIANIVEKYGFKVVRHARVWNKIPRTVWLVERK